MENSNHTVDLIQTIEATALKIKNKYEFLVFKDPTKIDQTLLDLVNAVALIKNLTKDVFSLIFLQTQEQRDKMFKAFPYLETYAPQLQTKAVNMVWYDKTLDIIEEILEDIEQADPQNRALVVFLQQKLKLFMVVYPYSITFDSDDIISLQKTNQKWDQVSKFTTFKVLGPPEKVKSAVQAFRKGIKIATAVLQKVSNSKNKLFSYMVGGLFYFFDQGQKNKKIIQFRSNMQINKVRTMVNFFEDGLSKFMIKTTFPFISFNTKIFINYTYPSLSSSVVEQWLKNRMQTPFKFGIAQKQLNESDPQLFNQTTASGKVCIRVLCHEDLKLNPKKKKFSKVIIHVHGGGFIGLSSRSHQVYTRRWAKQSKTPVFSVDYRKAPETPYPGPLDDCWQAYNWVLKESHKYFNIQQKKQIILAGDSAGGNLILGVTNLLIEHNLQKPLALLLFYPALNLLMESFTPSLMHSLQDPLLSFQFLFLCLRSYVQGQQFKPGTDYFISPILTPPCNLQQFPPVRLFAGEMDPLYDQSIRFGIKLRKSNVDVKMVSYENMIHGYLNLDVPGGVKYAGVCVDDSVEGVRQFTENK